VSRSLEKAGIERILPRYQFEARIKIEVRRGQEVVATEGWTRDLSESGLGAFVGAELQLGEVATVTIPLGGGDRQIVVPAKVSRNLGTQYGFQFTALSSVQREQIRKVLEKSKTIPYSTMASL
jgi:hypothetical protein